MSLGIAFKGPEGIVLAADSRVTLNAELRIDKQKTILPATFDNATKLLYVEKQTHVGAVTYGLGAINGSTGPRTAHSFLPEFMERLPEERMTVEAFAESLSEFFLEQIGDEYQGPDMAFLIGGYDENQPYGKVFELAVPSKPTPVERNEGQFGILWGGQKSFVDRLIQGYDPQLLNIVRQVGNISGGRMDTLETRLRDELTARIPYQSLPLQDCVDLSIFLVRTTVTIQQWIVDIRGVGGAIDVATITRTGGFKHVQQKSISGEEKS